MKKMPATRLTQLEIPDYELGLRGKLIRSEKLQSPATAAFCTIVYGLSLMDEVTDTSFSGTANGYPDLTVIPDESTRISLPWRGATDAVIGDLLNSDGTLFEASPRAVLKNLLAEYHTLDLEPVLGYEYEFWIFHDDGERDYRNMRPLGRTRNAYSLARTAEAASLIQEFIDRLESVDIPIETIHSELGPGLFEFAMSPQPALRAADNAARARQYLRDLCAEKGFLASFMAKPFGWTSGAGGHVHSSLTAKGKNVFARSVGELSPVGEQYLAGLIATMADFTALFTPYINSYKRIDPDMYVADRASWGGDDRRVACRLLLNSPPSARVEHRVPGADANPYVIASAVLGGGLFGITHRSNLASITAEETAKLPGDLETATHALLNSPKAKSLLGEIFVEAYAATRRSESERYTRWLHQNITDWELSRHLEHQ